MKINITVYIFALCQIDIIRSLENSRFETAHNSFQEAVIQVESERIHDREGGIFCLRFYNLPRFDRKDTILLNAVPT